MTNKASCTLWAVFTSVLMLFLLAGCSKKSDKAAESTNASNVPTAPAKPVPSFSAAQKVGMYVFPAKSQTHDQQLIDESECYDLARQQSGVNPEMAAPAAPTQGEMQAAQQQGAASAHQVKGGRLRGAARGAAGGAMVGAIAGDAGKGAAIGATVGTMHGGMKQRQTNASLKQSGAAQGGAQLQQQYQAEMADYDKQIESYKRAFSACLDSRGYSVK